MHKPTKHAVYDELTVQPIATGKNAGGVLFKFFNAGQLVKTKLHKAARHYGRKRQSFGRLHRPA